VLTKDEYAAVRAELAKILFEAGQADARESGEGPPGSTRLGKEVAPDQMREIVRRVRQQQEAAKQAAKRGATEPVSAPKEGEDEPNGGVAVDGDSGYYGGDAVGELLEEGVDVCVPDSNTAGDLHRRRPVGTTRARGREGVEFVYDEASDTYHCSEGNVLRARQ